MKRITIVLLLLLALSGCGKKELGPISMAIISDPGAASVFIDGTYKCKTPCSVTAAEKANVKLTHVGFQDYNTSVVSTQDGFLAVEMTPLVDTATLYIHTRNTVNGEDDVIVRINGESWGEVQPAPYLPQVISGLRVRGVPAAYAIIRVRDEIDNFTLWAYRTYEPGEVEHFYATKNKVDTIKPSKPTITASQQGTSIKLTWTSAGNDISHYYINRYATTGGDNRQIKFPGQDEIRIPGNITTMQDSDSLEAGKTYVYQIYAVDFWGNIGPFSEYGQVKYN